MPAGFKILDAYVEVKADAHGVADDAASQIRSRGSVMNRAGSGLGSALMSGMSGVIGGLVGGVTAAFATPLINGVNQALDQVMTTAKYAIFDYNTLLENAQIGFTTMLGSGEKATKMLGDLQEFAAKTPFEFSDLTLASQRLIAMGINAKDVIPTMTAIGDAVAGLGGDKGTIDQITTALGQMTAKGKIQGDELMQLTEAGIPALKILADTYGVTTGQMQDMISKGQVLADKAVPAIVRGLEKGTKTTSGFGGMMEKQSKTMSGSLSNIQDSVNQTISKAFLPLFTSVEKAAGKMATFAGSKAVKKWADDTAKSMDGFLTSVGKAVKEVFEDPKVQKSMKEFGATFSKALKDSGPELKKILPDLTKFTKDSLPGIIDGAGQLVKSLPELSKNLRELSKSLGESGKKFGETSLAIGTFVGDVLSNLDDLDTNVMGTLKAFWRWRDSVKDIFSGFPRMFAVFGSQIITGLIVGINSRLHDALDAIGNIGDSIAATFRAKLGIESPSKVFHQYGTWVAEGLHKGLLGSVDQIKSAGEKLADAVDKPMKAGVERVTKRLVQLGKQREKLTDTIKGVKDDLASLMSDKDSYRAGVRSSVLGAGDIVGLYGEGATTVTSSAKAGTLDGRAYTGSYTTSTTTGGGLGGIKSRLRTMVANTKQFTKNLKALVKMGIYSDLFQQLVQAGPTDGLALTNELLGDKASFQEINRLGKQLATAGNLLGDYASGVTYNGQIKSTQRRIDSLRDDRQDITAVMVIEANKIDEVHKVVKAVNALAKTAKAKKAVKK